VITFAIAVKLQNLILSYLIKLGVGLIRN